MRGALNPEAGAAGQLKKGRTKNTHKLFNLLNKTQKNRAGITRQKHPVLMAATR